MIELKPKPQPKQEQEPKQEPKPKQTPHRQHKSPQEFLDNLRTNGPKRSVDLSNERIDFKPGWFDELRFVRAKTAMNKFLSGVDFSSLTGLILVLQIPDALEPLLSTGCSRDIPALFRRYLSTIVHVRSWYSDDIFDPATKGYRSIRQVRAMHRRVQRTMNSQFRAPIPDINGSHRLWFNQYDVAITQFAFVGLALAFPEKCGLVSASEHELELINYYWRVLGFLMGLDDEFNLGHFEAYADARQLHRLILDQEFLGRFEREPCETGLKMTQAICLALKYYLPLVSFNSLAIWWQDKLKFNGYEPKPASARERLVLALSGLVFGRLLKSATILKWSTKMHVALFNSRLKKRDKVLKRLERKFENNDHFVFVSSRCDYLGGQPQIERPASELACPAPRSAPQTSEACAPKCANFARLGSARLCSTNRPTSGASSDRA